ncbi:hypothetical protein P355_5254 [Burkholderia cenocepacia KC-01]|nr:hypothetical protein P355_5254 [Burkholderia cenocepacia KC-01]
MRRRARTVSAAGAPKLARVAAHRPEGGGSGEMQSCRRL